MGTWQYINRVMTVQRQRGSTSKLAQPNLLGAGDHSVAEVIEGQAAGHLQGKVADHEGQKGQDVLGALCILIVWVHRGADDGC